LYAPHEQSEHPPDPPDLSNPLVGNVTHGMQWTVAQVNAIVKGGLWPSTAIFITWDDWGGQFRYGSRVGCLVLSPYTKPGYISKVQHSHVSLIKFCDTIFNLAPPNNRVKQADSIGLRLPHSVTFSLFAHAGASRKPPRAWLVSFPRPQLAA